jgi:hypothetical protein
MNERTSGCVSVGRLPYRPDAALLDLFPAESAGETPLDGGFPALRPPSIPPKTHGGNENGSQSRANEPRRHVEHLRDLRGPTTESGGARASRSDPPSRRDGTEGTVEGRPPDPARVEVVPSGAARPAPGAPPGGNQPGEAGYRDPADSPATDRGLAEGEPRPPGVAIPRPRSDLPDVAHLVEPRTGDGHVRRRIPDGRDEEPSGSPWVRGGLGGWGANPEPASRPKGRTHGAGPTGGRGYGVEVLLERLY